jgi:hypothetical protein
MNDCYFEIGGANLRCMVKHLEAASPDVQKETVTTFCGRVDYPGTTKWTLKLTAYQSFDAGSTFATLNAALTTYKATGAPCNFKARPYFSRVASSSNPTISGFVVPTDFAQLVGDAGSASEVDIEWDLTAPPTVDFGAVAATSAVAGAPGYYMPSGATPPATLAALTGVTASPTSAWTTGQYVITGDLLAANWTGAAWAAGKHA